MSPFCSQGLRDLGEGIELWQGILSTARMSMDCEAQAQGTTPGISGARPFKFDEKSRALHFGWMRRVKLAISILSSGRTSVRSSRGTLRPATKVGLRPLGVNQKRPVLSRSKVAWLRLTSGSPLMGRSTVTDLEPRPMVISGLVTGTTDWRTPLRQISTL